jgi:hypothetical protein
MPGGFRPYGLSWGRDAGVPNQPPPSGGQNFSALLDQSQQAPPSATPASSQPTNDWWSSWYANPANQGGFANTIEDLSQGGPMPTAPSLSDWERLGPFGRTALRYGLESAGYNWAPYSEAMLAGWRQSGQGDPNTGMSGWAAPHVTALGLQSMNPMQAEDLRENAELFGPWSDYLTRERRAWQTGLRPMTRIRA